MSEQEAYMKHFLCGLKLIYKEKFTEAFEEFEKSISLNPFFSDAYNCRSICKSKFGDMNGSYDDIQKALEINPRNYKVLNNLGNFHFNTQDFQSALKYYTRAIQFSNDRMIFRNRANTYSELGKPLKAISDYLKVLEYKKHDFKLFARIGHEYDKIEKTEIAKEYYEASLKLNPDQAEINWKIDFYEKETALREHRQTIPMPADNCELLAFGMSIPFVCKRYLKKGFIPRNKKDKWFIFFENENLYFHNSENGHCIYELHWERNENDIVAHEIIINKNFSFTELLDDFQVIMILIYGVLCYGYYGPEIKQSLIESSLEYISFDVLEDILGAFLYS